MKKNLMILMIGMLIVSMSNPVFAANKYGTKAHGMGGAFTAIADDASAVYWNPAGLTQTSLVGVDANLGGTADKDTIDAIKDFINNVEVFENEGNISAGQIRNLFNSMPDNAEMDINFFPAVNLGSIGVGILANNKFVFEKNNKEFENKISIPQGEARNLLVSQAIIGLGKELVDPPVVGSLSVGLGVKYLRVREDSARITLPQDYADKYNSKDVIDIKGDTENGLAFDLGALATVTDTDILNLKAGATVRNAYSSLDVEHESLDRTYTLGVGAVFKFPLVEILSARVAADLEIAEEGDKIKHIGAEATVASFSFRLGAYGTDLGDSDDRVITGGLGYNLPFIDLNLSADNDKYYSLSGTFNF